MRGVEIILRDERFAGHFLITLEDTTRIGERDFGFVNIGPGALGIGLRCFYCCLRINRRRLRYLYSRHRTGHIRTPLGDLRRQRCRIDLRDDLPLSHR